MALDPNERAALTLPDEQGDPGADDAWISEIERRVTEVRDGTAKLEEWTSVKQRLADRWSRKRLSASQSHSGSTGS